VEAKVGRVYKHKKGGIYKVDYIAIYTEIEEKLVIYHKLQDADWLRKDDITWARPYDIFCDGRFEKLTGG